MTDYFDGWGIHHGYMGVFAECLGLKLELPLAWHLNQAGEERFSPTGKADRLALSQQGIEIVRRSVSLEDLIKPAGQVEQSGEKTDRAFAEFLEAEIFSDGQPARLDVAFELLEWNISGPRQFGAFADLFACLAPPPFARWLKSEDLQIAGCTLEDSQAWLSCFDEDGRLTESTLLSAFDRLCTFEE